MENEQFKTIKVCVGQRHPMADDFAGVIQAGSESLVMMSTTDLVVFVENTDAANVIADSMMSAGFALDEPSRDLMLSFIFGDQFDTKFVFDSFVDMSVWPYRFPDTKGTSNTALNIHIVNSNNFITERLRFVTLSKSQSARIYDLSERQLALIAEHGPRTFHFLNMSQDDTMALIDYRQCGLDN